MSLQKKNFIRKKRRLMRVRSKIKRVSSLPRVSINRSLKHFYAQVIDDSKHATIISFSSLQLEVLNGDKKAIAYAVGVELSKKMIDKNINSVVLDRGSCLYHGRVAQFAEGLRSGGILL